MTYERDELKRKVEKLKTDTQPWDNYKMERNKVNNYGEQRKSEYIEAQIVENKDNSSNYGKY